MQLCRNKFIMGILRKTKSIKLILGEFTNETIAISVTDLINKLYLKINKSTVYRILEKLEDDNILYSFIAANGSKYYAKCRCRSKENTNHIYPHFEWNQGRKQKQLYNKQLNSSCWAQRKTPLILPSWPRR